MSVLFHSLVALTYIALGAAAAFGLPLLSAAVEPVLALFAGGAVLIGGALAHQSIVNNSRGRDIIRELSIVLTSNETMQRDLDAARNELRKMKSHFGDDNPLGASDMELEKNTRSSNEVLGELRLLRTLFSQLTSKKGAKKQAAPAKTMAAAESAAEAKAIEAGGSSELILDTLASPEQADAKSECRSSYMGLSSSLGQGGDGELVQFPSGGSQQTPASPALGSNAQDILAITRDALERARVSLFLQPIVSLPTRKVEYFEAYSRIQDHDGKFIGPHLYLELAESAGLVGAIDNNLLFRCI